MKPNRYPYSGKRKNLEGEPVNSVDIKACTIKLDQVSPLVAVRLLLKVNPLLVYKFRLARDEAVYYNRR